MIYSNSISKYTQKRWRFLKRNLFSQCIYFLHLVKCNISFKRCIFWVVYQTRIFCLSISKVQKCCSTFSVLIAIRMASTNVNIYVHKFKLNCPKQTRLLIIYLCDKYFYLSCMQISFSLSLSLSCFIIFYSIIQSVIKQGE